MKGSKVSVYLLVLAAILFIAGAAMLVVGMRKNCECKEKNDNKSGALHSWHGLTGDGDDPGLGWVI